MGRRLVLHTAAQVDMDNAALWYEGEQPGLGVRFLDELSHLFLRISDRPLQFPHIESDVRRAMLRRFPYGVYFLVETDRVLVIAVLHLHRDFDIRLRIP